MGATVDRRQRGSQLVGRQRQKAIPELVELAKPRDVLKHRHRRDDLAIRPKQRRSVDQEPRSSPVRPLELDLPLSDSLTVPQRPRERDLGPWKWRPLSRVALVTAAERGERKGWMDLPTEQRGRLPVGQHDPVGVRAGQQHRLRELIDDCLELSSGNIAVHTTYPQKALRDDSRYPNR